MKLTYWHAECFDDSSAYDIRTRTRKEAKEQVAIWVSNSTRYGPIKKVTVEYSNAFDLMEQCSNEGRMGWEAA